MSLDAESGAVADEMEPMGEIAPDAEEVLGELAVRGELTAPRVVEEARDAASPLHRHFDWNDTTAAHAHRLNQARALIRSVRVEVTVHEHVFKAPAYVHDPDRDNGGGYIPTPKLANDREMAQRVMRQEIARVQGCLDRARKVAAALGMESEIAEVAANVGVMMEALDRAA